MANPTIRDSVISGTVGAKLNSSVPITSLSFRRRDERPYIYSNYPEAMGVSGKGEAYAENGYYINKQQIDAGEAHIFFSHTNHTSNIYKFGIQAYNPTGNPITFTVKKSAYTAGWDSAGTIRDFYLSNTNTSQTINSGKYWWFCKDQTIKANNPFNGIYRIQTTGPVIITSYVYSNLSNIDGNEKAFPRNTTVATSLGPVTGIGKGYVLLPTINLSIGGTDYDLSQKPFHYHIADERNPIYNSSTGIGDLTPIKCVTGETISTGLGNYTTEYSFTVKINNNTTAAKTVYGFTSATSGRPCIISGGSVSAKDLQDSSWRFFQESIPAKTTKEFQFSIANGSYGNGALVNAFSLNANIK